MRYDVDPQQLRALAAGLRSARAGIDRLSRSELVGRSPATVLGSPLVARGLHDVRADWSTARSRISRELEALAAAVVAAAAAYSQADGDAAAALPSSAAPR